MWRTGTPHSQMAGGDRWVLWALASSLAPECTHKAEQKPRRLRCVNFNQKRHLRNIQERTVLQWPRGDQNYLGTQEMILVPKEVIHPACQEDWPFHSDNETAATPAERTHSPTSGYLVISFIWGKKEQRNSWGIGAGHGALWGVCEGSGGTPPGENEAQRATDLARLSEIRKCLLWQRASHELIIGT